MPTRADAYTLMTTHVKNENLQKHMLAVEVAMRFYARKYGEDEELWGMTGLLHDCDYEKYPDLREHTQVLAQWLREGGYDERIIYAILTHPAFCPNSSPCLVVRQKNTQHFIEWCRVFFCSSL
jgi:putative nucleotidyltransferase with HDIG domain